MPRTGSPVARPGKTAAPALSAPEKICLFRFVQKTLNNADRHAAGAGQAVEVAVQPPRPKVTDCDRGPGFDPHEARADGLRLVGIEERVESIGRQFAPQTSSAGTRGFSPRPR